jgi:hypothetical protein
VESDRYRRDPRTFFTTNPACARRRGTRSARRCR